MTIDISKIRPGDKVTLVPLEVIAVDCGGGQVHVTDSDVGAAYFNFDQIAAHHPAAREIGVGDRVQSRSGMVGTIRGIDGDQAWVLWDPGYWSTTSVGVITLVEGGE